MKKNRISIIDSRSDITVKAVDEALQKTKYEIEEGPGVFKQNHWNTKICIFLTKLFQLIEMGGQ